MGLRVGYDYGTKSIASFREGVLELRLVLEESAHVLLFGDFYPFSSNLD